jgi:protein-tyrosine-phosphatase
MKKLHIHFVCRANIYRSRLAEGYFKKLTGDKYIVSSSGIERWRHPFNYKDRWANMLAKEHGFELSPKSIQSSSEIYSKQDVLVFARQDVYDGACHKYHFDKKKAVVWDIKDRGDYPFITKRKIRRNETWKSIDYSVKKLIKMLESGEINT